MSKKHPLTPLTFFKCLADSTRLQSILLIYQHGELCVCDLQVALSLSQPKISRHLAQLREYGLLLDSRQGKWVYYQLHPQLPDWASEVINSTHLANSELTAVANQRLANQKTNPNC